MKRIGIALALILGCVAIGVIALSGSSNTIRTAIMAQAMPSGYFSAYERITPKLYQVSGPVYAFEKGFSRSMVIRSPNGVAVFDTFSVQHVKALQKALENQFPGEAVRWIVYSHNHLDHIRGSDLFPDAEIIGHKDVNQLVKDWPKAGEGVASVTQAISGDQTLNLGGVEVEAIYMPFSHSSTLYGFYIPSASTVFAADMMFVKAVPPFGFPDFYYPGYIRAIDRLIALNASHYIPSHMDRGTRDDLIAFRDMTVDFQEVVKSEFLEIGVDNAEEEGALQAMIKAAYDKLQPKYGDLHGFNDMFVAKFGRHAGGAFLGY